MTRGEHPRPCAVCLSLPEDDQEANATVDALITGMQHSLTMAGMIGDWDVQHPTGAGVGPCSEAVAKIVVESVEALVAGKLPPLYKRYSDAHGDPPQAPPEVIPDWLVVRVSYGPMPGGEPGELRVELAFQNKEACS